MMIKDRDYNLAKAKLVANGSVTAAKSHNKHTQGKGSPEGHGRSLLREAQGEWGANITLAQTQALADAAEQMGIDWP
ncbi:hypothetical protein U737_22440 [Methylomonas sp. LW13]|nr:hypothetical protein U737_22440 [Methylomonas sp. LW13]